MMQYRVAYGDIEQLWQAFFLSTLNEKPYG
jgi:hypothetical protein